MLYTCSKLDVSFNFVRTKFAYLKLYSCQQIGKDYIYWKNETVLKFVPKGSSLENFIKNYTYIKGLSF